MLSIQHILSALYAYNTTYINDKAAAIVYPDAIRAYTGSRKYSHFEHAYGNVNYYMKFPSSMYTMREEIEDQIQKVEEELNQQISGNLSQMIQNCAIGEPTSLIAFCDANHGLPKKMYDGIWIHLKQDVLFDHFIREEIDCSRKYEDIYVFHGSK